MCKALIFLLLFLPLKALGTEPADSTMQKKVLLKPAIIAAGAVTLGFFLDKSVKADNKLQNIGDITDYAGDKKFVIPAVILTYGTSRFLTEDDKLRHISEASVKSLLVTSVLTETIKHLAGRARPFTGHGPDEYRPFPGNRDEFKSLPSGHASLAFAVFTPFAEGYSRWIYLVPVSVSAGRVFKNKHWISDVALGGGIGFLSGYFFYYNKKRVKPIPNGLVVYF